MMENEYSDLESILDDNLEQDPVEESMLKDQYGLPIGDQYYFDSVGFELDQAIKEVRGPAKEQEEAPEITLWIFQP